MIGLNASLKTLLPELLLQGFTDTDLALAEWLAVDGVSLIALPEGLTGDLAPLFVPEKLPTRPKRTGQRKKEGLLWMAEEALNRWDQCPGGAYGLVTELGPAVRLLNHWAAMRCWAAVDLETGVGIREQLDPVTGQTVKRYVAGSDPFTSPILLCSVSVEPGVAIVFDMRRLQREPLFVSAFAWFLTQCRLICHNASFEQGFFRAQFQVFGNICFDTMIVHQLLTAGAKGGSDLESVLTKYEGLEQEKRWQKFFIQIHPESPLPNEAIAYSAGDVCRLLSAAQKIDAEFLASGQYHIWTEVERPFMRWIAEAIHTGVAIDRALLEELLQKAEIERDTHLGRFQALAPEVLISSWQQLLPWFAERGVKIPDTQDETMKGVIARAPAGAAVGQAAEAILSYRAAAKVASTYIEPYLTKLVNPATGKIHPSWKQTSTVTGRMACAQPNFQNIPSNGEYTRIRNALVAPPGMKLAWLDYSQFEVRALADAADEPKMLAVFHEAYQVNRELDGLIERHCLSFSLEQLTELPQKQPEIWAGLTDRYPELAPLVQRAYECDFHRRTAATLFKKPVNAITKEERAKSKCITFGLPYGAGPKAVSEQAKISMDEAKQLIREYERTFPAVKLFLDKCKQQGRAGRTQTAYGRIRQYTRPNEMKLGVDLLALSKTEGAEKKWRELAAKWETDDPRQMAEKMAKAQTRAIEREATNQPIQGANADATKLATVLAGPELKALHPDCTVLMWVHDEIVLQAPERVIHEAARILRGAMVAAAEQFMSRCPVETSVSIGDCWGK